MPHQMSLHFVKKFKQITWRGISIFDDVNSRGGGGFSAKCRVGVSAHSFKMELLARPIFVKTIPLARLMSPLKVP